MDDDKELIINMALEIQRNSRGLAFTYLMGFLLSLLFAFGFLYHEKKMTELKANQNNTKGTNGSLDLQH